jgi:O-methyltransferase involved in polyketide biosynthesis
MLRRTGQKEEAREAYRAAFDLTQNKEVSSMSRYRGISNEVLNFGIEEGQIERFLAARGFSLVRNVAAADLHGRYFNGKNARRKVNAGYAIATAIV